MKQFISIVVLIFGIGLYGCGSAGSVGGITLDAPTADIEGAGVDRAKLCGSVEDAPAGTVLRITNTEGSDINIVDVTLDENGAYNVMIIGNPASTYTLTLLDSNGNAISETSDELVRGERVDDADQDCSTLQSNLTGGSAADSPEEGSDLDAPIVTVEPLNSERAQLCGTISDTPSDAQVKIESHFDEATNTEYVNIADDGQFSAIAIGDSTTTITVTVVDSNGNSISPAAEFTFGDIVVEENLTCPDVSNVDLN